MTAPNTVSDSATPRQPANRAFNSVWDCDLGPLFSEQSRGIFDAFWAAYQDLQPFPCPIRLSRKLVDSKYPNFFVFFLLPHLLHRALLDKRRRGTVIAGFKYHNLDYKKYAYRGQIPPTAKSFLAILEILDPPKIFRTKMVQEYEVSALLTKTFGWKITHWIHMCQLKTNNFPNSVIPANHPAVLTGRKLKCYAKYSPIIIDWKPVPPAPEFDPEAFERRLSKIIPIDQSLPFEIVSYTSSSSIGDTVTCDRTEYHPQKSQSTQPEETCQPKPNSLSSSPALPPLSSVRST